MLLLSGMNWASLNIILMNSGELIYRRQKYYIVHRNQYAAEVLGAALRETARHTVTKGLL
jgi:hypothetical protein